MDVVKFIYDSSSFLFDVFDNDTSNLDNYCFCFDSEEFISVLRRRVDSFQSVDLTYSDIFQFSNFENCTFELVKKLHYSGNKGLSFEDVGKILIGGNRKDTAFKKYGENHSKTAFILGLVKITKVSSKSKIFLTNMGYFFFLLNESDRSNLLKYLILKSNFIMTLISKSLNSRFSIRNELSFLKDSTYKRRLPNLNRMYRELISGYEAEFSIITNGVDEYGA